MRRDGADALPDRATLDTPIASMEVQHLPNNMSESSPSISWSAIRISADRLGGNGEQFSVAERMYGHYRRAR
jgi:hypothetical protein